MQVDIKSSSSYSSSFSPGGKQNPEKETFSNSPGSEFKYAITLASFKKLERIEDTLEKLSKQGFTFLEMYGEPEGTNTRDLAQLFYSYDFKILGLTGMWGRISPDGWKRKILSLDYAIRKHTENYVRGCIKMCDQLGGNKINVCLFSDSISSFDVTHKSVDKDYKGLLLSKSFSLLNQLTKEAKERNVELMLEPLNRYSTPYCSSLEDALYVANNCTDLKVMLDTFHMNIEEDSFHDAIVRAGPLLSHMHFAENNRKMPGVGHIDFKAIISALKEIRYCNAISFEPTLKTIDYENEVKNGMEFVIRLEHGNGE
jgi:sugar phosphate isomerase/epimerase